MFHNFFLELLLLHTSINLLLNAEFVYRYSDWSETLNLRICMWITRFLLCSRWVELPYLPAAHSNGTLLNSTLNWTYDTGNSKWNIVFTYEFQFSAWLDYQLENILPHIFQQVVLRTPLFDTPRRNMAEKSQHPSSNNCIKSKKGLRSKAFLRYSLSRACGSLWRPWNIHTLPRDNKFTTQLQRAALRAVVALGGRVPHGKCKLRWVAVNERFKDGSGQ